jgi:hypothetical protein
MYCRDHRIAKMMGLGTIITALRHSALLVSESILVCEDAIDQKRDRLDHVRSMIDRLEITLEVERRSEGST